MQQLVVHLEDIVPSQQLLLLSELGLGDTVLLVEGETEGAASVATAGRVPDAVALVLVGHISLLEVAHELLEGVGDRVLVG